MRSASGCARQLPAPCRSAEFPPQRPLRCVRPDDDRTASAGSGARLAAVSALVVLGGGWVGTAVAASAAAAGEVVVVDPPLDPVLARRDRTAAAALVDLIDDSGAGAVVNACGRIAGTDDELHDANVAFPTWLCEVLHGRGVRLVHVGSASELGDPGTTAPVDEDHPCRPTGAYAETKLAGTRVVRAAADAGLTAVVARVFNLAAASVPPSSPLAQWLTDLMELPPGGGRIEVWWPETVRDFVRLADAAEALVDLSAVPDPPEVVNVCSGVGLAYGRIVDALADRLGIEAQIVSLDRPGIPAVIGDPTRLMRSVGRVPLMDAERLAATVLPSIASDQSGDRSEGPSDGDR